MFRNEIEIEVWSATENENEIEPETENEVNFVCFLAVCARFGILSSNINTSLQY